MKPPAPRVHPLGTAALTITLGATVDHAMHRRVLALADAVRRLPLVHVQEIVPAAATVTVFYDSRYLTYADLARRLRALAQSVLAGSTASAVTGRHWEVPVAYAGPDLAAVAAAARMSPEEVVARHSGRTYTVFFLGFAPGFAYLGPLDDALVLPRRPTPRRVVPVGAVAIGGAQTAVYPLPTPGGWHLLGQTPLRPFDPARTPPVLFAAGDTVRFVATGA